MGQTPYAEEVAQLLVKLRADKDTRVRGGYRSGGSSSANGRLRRRWYRSFTVLEVPQRTPARSRGMLGVRFLSGMYRHRRKSSVVPCSPQRRDFQSLVTYAET